MSNLVNLRDRGVSRQEINFLWETLTRAVKQLTGVPRDFYNGNTGFSKGGRMRSIGFPELLVILGVAVLLFGGKKIPEVAKGLGEGIRNFKTALKGEPDKPATPEVVVEKIETSKV